MVDEHFPGKDNRFTKLWFATIQRYCFQTGMMERYLPWEDLTRAAFRLAAFEAEMDVPDDLRDELIAADETLPVYDDARKGLSRLAGKYQLYVLSMGSASMILKSQANSAIDGFFTGILTTQEAAVYKPGRHAYEVGVEGIGLPREQIGFVSGNSFDVLGSRNFGFPTIWVRRYGQPEQRKGEAIPLFSQIALPAQVVDVFHTEGGENAAHKEINARTATWFDPAVVAAFNDLSADKRFWTDLASTDLEAKVLALEPARANRYVDEDYLDDIAQAFAQVVLEAIRFMDFGCIDQKSS